MLCSISTGKSGSNWLNRLRSSKGFPAGDHLDLEQFLNLPTPNTSGSPDSKFSNKIDPESSTNPARSDERPVVDGNLTTESSYENGDRELFGLMSNVLSELFNMGDTDDFSRINGKKSSRKQRNPKICALSTSDDMRGRDEGVSSALPLNFNNSHDETKPMTGQLKLMEQEDGNVHADLSAFSRTEVTVIDTSFPTWKFEKMLFRRKNVWKIRDKKGKTMSANRRKRKAGSLSENVGKEKKQCSSYKDANCSDGVLPSNERPKQDNKMEDTWEETPNILRQVQEKRFPRKSKTECSSVVLIKSIPTSKRSGSSVKSFQRQQKA